MSRGTLTTAHGSRGGYPVKLRWLFALFAAMAALALMLVVLGPRNGARDALAPEVDLPGSGAAEPALFPPSAVDAPALAATPAPDDERCFEGRVTSGADGSGVAGAELTFAMGNVAASVRAGAGGAFRFDPPVEGVWMLAAATAPGFLPFAPEWATSAVLLEARRGARVGGIEVVLRPAVEYRGEVLDPAGAAVVGAEVRILGAGAGRAALVPLEERHVTGTDGHFAFVALDGAELEARAEGFAPGRAEIDLAARASRRVTIRLRAGAAPRADEIISGALVQASGAPVAGALVVATPRGAGAPVGQAVTDASGAFTIRNLPEGLYRLEASAAGLAPARHWRIRTGTRDVVLRLGPGGTIGGRVRDRRTGAPVTTFVVSVFMREGPPVPMRSLTVIDAEGDFVVGDLAPGPAEVVIVSPAHAPSPREPVLVDESGTSPWLEVELGAGGALEGVVLDRATRQPISGAEVEAEGVWLEPAGVLPLPQRAASGSEGRFHLAGLREGPAPLLVRAAGHHARIVAGLEVREGRIAGPVLVDLAALEPGDEPRVELATADAELRGR